jgi:hypothetical protein
VAQDSWEVFTDRAGRPGAGEVYVTQQRRGLLTLSPAAFKGLGSPAAVEFLFNPGRGAMGLRQAGPAVPHAYPLRRQDKAASHFVSGVAFLRRHGVKLDISQARKLPATIEDGVLVIELPADE